MDAAVLGGGRWMQQCLEEGDGCSSAWRREMDAAVQALTQHFCAPRHIRRDITLKSPDIEVIINHEIETEPLEAPSLVVYEVLYAVHTHLRNVHDLAVVTFSQQFERAAHTQTHTNTHTHTCRRRRKAVNCKRAAGTQTRTCTPSLHSLCLSVLSLSHCLWSVSFSLSPVPGDGYDPRAQHHRQTYRGTPSVSPRSTCNPPPHPRRHIHHLSPV